MISFNIYLFSTGFPQTNVWDSLLFKTNLGAVFSWCWNQIDLVLILSDIHLVVSSDSDKGLLVLGTFTVYIVYSSLMFKDIREDFLDFQGPFCWIPLGFGLYF